MKLYVVEYKGYTSNYEEWETINIWKTRANAECAMSNYKNWTNSIKDPAEYRIVEIDTDIKEDCIYDIVDGNEE